MIFFALQFILLLTEQRLLGMTRHFTCLHMIYLSMRIPGLAFHTHNQLLVGSPQILFVCWLPVTTKQPLHVKEDDNMSNRAFESLLIYCSCNYFVKKHSDIFFVNLFHPCCTDHTRRLGSSVSSWQPASQHPQPQITGLKCRDFPVLHQHETYLLLKLILLPLYLPPEREKKKENKFADDGFPRLIRLIQHPLTTHNFRSNKPSIPRL